MECLLYKHNGRRNNNSKSNFHQIPKKGKNTNLETIKIPSII